MSFCSASIVPCALTGAAAFFGGIKDVAILINGPVWCYHYILQYLQDADPEYEPRLYCTQSSENDVVYGAEKSLLQAAAEIEKRQHNIKLVVVINSCAMSLIGDDVEGILKEKLDCPLIVIDGGGLKGDFWHGYRQAIQVLYNFLNLSQTAVLERSVNLIGVCRGNYNWKNDCAELVRMLNLIDVQVLNVLGGQSTVESLKDMSKAALNVVISPAVGLEVADLLKNDYGTPYLVLPIPYGIRGSKIWVESVAAFFGMNTAQTNYCEEEKRIRSAVNLWREKLSLNGGLIRIKKTVIIGNADVVCALSSFISENIKTQRLYMGLRDYDSQVDKIVLSANTEMFDACDSARLLEILSASDVELCWASSNERMLLNRLKRRCIMLNICNPVHDEVLLTDRPFAGFNGVLTLCESLFEKYMDFYVYRLL